MEGAAIGLSRRPPIRDRRCRCYWRHRGAVLARAGISAVLVARGRNAEVLTAQGMTLRTPDGTFRTAVTTASRLAEVRLTERDVLVFATKTQQVDAALVEWVDQPVHGPDGVIGTAGELLPAMTALNGVAAEEKALRYFRRVFGICVWLPAVHLEPGEVIVRSWPVAGQFHIARWPASVSTQGDADLLTGLAGTWSAAGIRVHTPNDVAPWKYNKLLSNLGCRGRAVRRGGRHKRSRGCGAQRRRKRAAARGNRIRLVRDIHRGAGARTDNAPGTRLEWRTEQLHVAVVEPQHRQRGDRLSQRGDRPDRSPTRHHGAAECRAGTGSTRRSPERPRAGPATRRRNWRNSWGPTRSSPCRTDPPSTTPDAAHRSVSAPSHGTCRAGSRVIQRVIQVSRSMTPKIMSSALQSCMPTLSAGCSGEPLRSSPGFPVNAAR